MEIKGKGKEGGREGGRKEGREGWREGGRERKVRGKEGNVEKADRRMICKRQRW